MRRSLVTVGLVVLLGASMAVQAQAQTPAAPAAPQAAPADPLRFTTDDAAVIIQVAPGKAADFEAGFKWMQDGLAASDNPDLKAVAASMNLRKAVTGGPDIYVLMVTNASKTLSYSWGKLIYFAGKEPSPEPALLVKAKEGQDAVALRADVDAMYKKLNESILVNGGAQQISVLPLVKVGG